MLLLCPLSKNDTFLMTQPFPADWEQSDTSDLMQIHLLVPGTLWQSEFKCTLITDRFAIKCTFSFKVFNMCNPILKINQGLKHDPEQYADWSLISSAGAHVLSFENTKSLKRQQQQFHSHVWGFIVVHTEGRECVAALLCFPHSSSWMWTLAQRDDLAMSSHSALALANWYFSVHNRVIHLILHNKLPHDYKIVPVSSLTLRHNVLLSC